jgi:hypothetical protein
MATLWPWLVVAGLGAFHGLNPAMGWLFAVALGLHRKSRGTVAAALVPIAVGHALAIAVVVVLFLAAGTLFDPTAIRWGSAVLLVGWAIYHALYGHRGRVRFGMQVGLAGLLAWSFLMATAHGAGLMLMPALVPLCLGDMPGELADASLATASAAVGLHTLTMLAVTAAIALAVYEWIGVDFLRRGWFNLDRVWTAALVATAAALLVW